MKYDLKRHNCFWVYQNQTFFEESNGGISLVAENTQPLLTSRVKI